MPGITVVGTDAAGGVQLGGGQSLMKVEGQDVVVVGDPVSPHGIAPHIAPTMTGGKDWFRVEGKAVIVQGDAATCGHTTSGRGWFRVN